MAMTNDLINNRTLKADAEKPTYRYRDPERWRAYMRAYMRKRRARERAERGLSDEQG